MHTCIIENEYPLQMKLYAMKQSIAAPIDNLYNPKAESINTLGKFFAGKTVMFGGAVSGYSFFFQLFFPLVACFCCGVLMFHIFHSSSLRDIRKYFKTSKESSNKPIAMPSPEDSDFSSRNLYILMACIGSIMFIFYVLILDCVAMGERESFPLGSIFMTKKDAPYKHDAFALEYIVPIFMFIYDFIVMTLLIVFIFLKQCCNTFRVTHWYFVLLGPITCVVVHLYHIIVSFIHTPYHASSVFIFYAIVFFVYVFAFRSTYYCFPKVFKKCFISTCSEEEKYKKRCHLVTMICCLSVVSFFVFVIMFLIVLLFLFVPINLAIDDAPARVLGLTQTIVFLLSVGVAYKLFFTHKVNELVNMLVETQDIVEEVEDVTSYANVNNDELQPGYQSESLIQQTPESPSEPDPDCQQVTKIKDWSKMERTDKEHHMKKRLLQIVHAKTREI